MKPAVIVAAFTRRRGVTVEPGWGAGNLVLKLGAKIFAKSGTRFDPRKNGRVMKEWLVANARADGLSLAEEAHAFARKAASPRRPKRG